MTPPPAAWRVRPAKPHDADAMGRVHHRSWVETYTGLVPDEFWQRGTIDTRVRMWRSVLGTPDAPRDLHGTRALVGERTTTDGQHEIVGLALAGPPRTGDPDHPAVADSAQLAVAEKNPRAIAFYRRNGFAPDGARGTLDWFGGITEIRLVRAARTR